MPGFPDLSTGTCLVYAKKYPPVDEQQGCFLTPSSAARHGTVLKAGITDNCGWGKPWQMLPTLTDVVLTQAGSSRVFLVVSVPCEQLDRAGWKELVKVACHRTRGGKLKLRAMKLVKQTLLEGLSSSVKTKRFATRPQTAKSCLLSTSKPLVRLKSKYFCELENGKQNCWVFV